MRDLIVRTQLFRSLRPGVPASERERVRSERVLAHFLNALSETDEDYLAEYPNSTRLYESGIVYHREPRGWEIWQDYPTMLKTLQADCEDLSCELAAEFRKFRGWDAWPFPYGKWRPGGWIYHIIVDLGDGTFADPSVRLGMKRPSFYPGPIREDL